MDRYLTITSKQENPAEFHSDVLEALDLEGDYEVAVLSIFHPPPFNVTKNNNKFRIQSLEAETIQDFTIPEGYYIGSCDILAAMYRSLLDSRDSILKKMPKFEYSRGVGESSSLTLAEKYTNFIVDPDLEGHGLLRMLTYCSQAALNKLVINHYDIATSPKPGLLYANFVENSFINQQQSRLLAIVPLLGNAYNYFEFTNPKYCKLSARAFINANFTMTDIFGDLIRMDPQPTTHDGNLTVSSPTIIQLHLREIV